MREKKATAEILTGEREDDFQMNFSTSKIAYENCREMDYDFEWTTKNENKVLRTLKLLMKIVERWTAISNGRPEDFQANFKNVS